MKVLLCLVKGHKFDEPSIVNTLNPNNWLKRCSRCGLYIMHGNIGSVPLTKREAYKVKQEFEEEFPYSRYPMLMERLRMDGKREEK